MCIRDRFKSIAHLFKGSEVEQIYDAVRAYVEAFRLGTKQLGVDGLITNPIVFRGMFLVFPEAAQRVKDRYQSEYSTENFLTVLEPMFGKWQAQHFRSPGNSPKEWAARLVKWLKTDFTL